MSTVVNRFLNYVKYDTQSDEESTTVPSTPKQMQFAKVIVKELEEIGLKEVVLDNYGYVYATLPSNVEKNIPTIGFIAHMDTSPDMSGTNVEPKLIENYNGEDIVLNEDKAIVLSPKDFPDLKKYVGKTLITTDGTTLLGADDKAGMAEIITAMEYLINNPDIPHGKIRIAFTPDEEVGHGADYFNVEQFGTDFAYTIDGGPIGELEYENFNAAKAIIRVQGNSVHPGTAKGTMVNSILLANEFISLLPANDTPADSEGYEGFYHLNTIKGKVEETTLRYFIRDFDRENFEKRKTLLEEIGAQLNEKYGAGTFQIDITDQYFNMKEQIEPVIHIIDTALQAMKEVGVEPVVKPIRGGTDGARLSFMGLPTPNIFGGGHNFHGKYEYIPTFTMDKAVEVILKIVELYTKA